MQTESITIIGDVSLGNVPASNLVSVLSLENSEEATMLLQSLDQDANPSNGITITNDIFEAFMDSKIEISSVSVDNKQFLQSYKDSSGKDFTINKVEALQHANTSIMLENLKAASENLYAYYIGDANIFYTTDSKGAKANLKLLMEKSSRRLQLYNYRYTVFPELTLMATTIKHNIDTSFDTHEQMNKFITESSMAVSEALVVANKKPQNFLKHVKEQGKDFAKGQLLEAGKAIVDEKYPNIPTAAREALYREMTLVYGCADMFAKPTPADMASCANTLGSETLNILNDAATAWSLYGSAKDLNAITLTNAYLDEYFNAGGDYNFIYARYGVDNETDYIEALKKAVLVPSNTFWTEGEYLVNEELFTEKVQSYKANIIAQTNKMIRERGLKANYDARDNSILLPRITKGKYNVLEKSLSICYEVENSSYLDINNILLNIDVQNNDVEVSSKSFQLKDLYLNTDIEESCFNVPLNENFTGFDNNYFVVNASLSFNAEGKSLSAMDSKAIYLSESTIFDLLKKVAPPTIILHRALEVKDQDIYLVSASESFVDASQGALSFTWKQIDVEDYKVTIDHNDTENPTITMPQLPSGIISKTLYFEVKAVASVSKKETIKTFSVAVNANAQTAIELPQADAGSDVTIYEGQSYTFVGKNSNTSYLKTDEDIDWYWFNEASELLSYEKSFSKVFDKNGTYTFTLEVSDSSQYNQSLTSRDTVVIHVLNAIDNGSVISLSSLSDWIVYGSASLENTKLIFGDSIGYDTNDTDKDLNPYNIWYHGSTTADQGADYDEVVSKKDLKPPFTIEFSGCFPDTKYGGNVFFIGKRNKLFTGKANSKEHPVDSKIAFSTTWDRTGLRVMRNNNYDDSVEIQDAILKDNHYCGKFKLDYDGSVINASFNDVKVFENAYTDDGSALAVGFRSFEHEFIIDDITFKSTQ